MWPTNARGEVWRSLRRTNPVALLQCVVDEIKMYTQAKNMQAEWQYMLVERMEPPTQTSGGLFLPSSEEVR